MPKSIVSGLFPGYVLVPTACIMDKPYVACGFRWTPKFPGINKLDHTTTSVVTLSVYWDDCSPITRLLYCN